MRVVKIQSHGNASAVTIPRAYLQELGWQLGEHVKLAIVDGSLVVSLIEGLRPAVAIARKPLERGQHAKV